MVANDYAFVGFWHLACVCKRVEIIVQKLATPRNRYISAYYKSMVDDKVGSGRYIAKPSYNHSGQGADVEVAPGAEANVAFCYQFSFNIQAARIPC